VGFGSQSQVKRRKKEQQNQMNKKMKLLTSLIALCCTTLSVAGVVPIMGTCPAGQQGYRCLTCDNAETGYTLQEVGSGGWGGDGGWDVTYKVLVDTKSNGQQDVTSESTWTSSNSSVVKVNGPGQLEYPNPLTEAGVEATITLIFPIQLFNCNTGCYAEWITINFKSETAITYANYTGVTNPDGLNIQDCGATQTGACTASTMPVLAPINGVRIGDLYSCHGAPAGDQWQVFSACWGYGSLGPFCTSIPGLTGSGLSTSPKPCTPATAWK
jgi:hypothetical protein